MNDNFFYEKVCGNKKKSTFAVHYTLQIYQEVKRKRGGNAWSYGL